MARLGPEWRGRVPPELAEGHKRQLEEIAKIPKLGIGVQGARIFGCPDCQISLEHQDIVFPLGSVPALPLPGCDRSPCCGCCYGPVLEGWKLK